MSMYSPSFSPDFGCFMRSKNESLVVSWTSDQVKSEVGENAFSSDAKISPKRVEPKKETTAADHTTYFDSGVHGELAIL